MSIKKLLLYFLLAFTMSTIAANNKVSSREISSIATPLAVESPQAQWGLAGPNGEVPTTWVAQGTLTDAIAYAKTLVGTAYIKLLSNVNTTAILYFYSGTTTVLDLNGYTIDRGLTSGINNGRVIDIIGTLTLKDGSTNVVANQGKITGGYNTGSSGGCINVSGTFLMQGGNITGNKTNNEGNGGGGVFILSGNFTMTGGCISNNSAKYWGGGVGLYSGSFTMIGGSITGNNTFAGNSACGGGIYMGSTFTVGGTAVIENNTNTDTGVTYERNVYMSSKVNVSTTTPLTKGAFIGVTASSPSSYPVTVTNSNSVDYSSYFFSDNVNYMTQNSGTGSSQVVKLVAGPPLPTITSITPSACRASDFTTITIKGTTFTSESTVKFGDVTLSPSQYTIVDANTIQLTAPPHDLGTLDVTVTTAGRTSRTSPTSKFTYYGAPTVSLGNATYNDNKYSYPNATISSYGNIHTLLINFSSSSTPGDVITLPATIPAGGAVSTDSNNYSKSISFSSGATATEVQDFLRGVTFTLGGVAQTVNVTASTDNVTGTVFYNDATQHYYQFVPYASGTTGTWIDAYAAAKASNYMGRTGYLATVTSKNEDVFINSLSGNMTGWLGGTLLNHGAKNGIHYDDFILTTSRLSSDYASSWYWACGPEIGQAFYTEQKLSLSADDASNTAGYYFNWGVGTEPSGVGSDGESCLTTLVVSPETGYGSTTRLGVQGTAFSWNDIAYNRSYDYSGRYLAKGYFVEYGNLPIGDDGSGTNYSTGSAKDSLIFDLNVSEDQTISTSAIYNTVSVAPGKSLTVADGVNVRIGSLTLQSDATGTATFLNYGTAVVDAANVQQYLSTESNREWYYLSSPVTGATSSLFGLGDRVGQYVEELHDYTSPFTTSTALQSGTGYVVKLAVSVNNPTYTFSGVLNDGNISVPVTRQSDTNGKRGFNLVGNPYPSYLDWSAVASNNVMSTIWTRSYNGTAMHFVTYNATYDITLPDVATDINGKFIAPLQAFWVKVPMEKEGQSGLTLDFTNAMRCHATAGSSILRAPALNIKSAMPLLRLNLSNGTNNDQTVLVFSNVASNDYDEYDSPKMSNETASIPELYTMANGEALAINGMSDIPAKLALGFRSKENNTFSINAPEVKNFAAGMQIILQDNLLNSEFDLTNGASYTFNSDATDNTGRFNIIFRDQQTPTNIIGINDSSSIKAYSLNGEIIVEGVANELLEIYNSLGQKVSNGGLPTGVYVVKVVNKSVKVIVR